MVLGMQGANPYFAAEHDLPLSGDPVDTARLQEEKGNKEVY